LHLGNKCNEQFVQQVFGYANSYDMKFNGINAFYPLEYSEPSTRLSGLIEQIKAEKGGAYQPLQIIYADDPGERDVLAQVFVEDSGDVNKDFPYNDFLCMLHKMIRNKS